jgi:Cof subfamily protein (haloacid dehalogenase superfamily)
MSGSAVRLVLSDVDGTLVTSQKVLTPRAIRAVEKLHDAQILFAITSARPPGGLEMFFAPLGLTTPLAAFNGGLMINRDWHILQEFNIPDDLATPIIEVFQSHDVSVWVYRGMDWLVLDLKGPHVEHEAHAIHLEPKKIASFQGVGEGVTKIVGVSDDSSAMDAANTTLQEKFSGQVSVSRSQEYYLDVTHLDANKGRVVDFLSSMYDIAPEQIATIGDMHNDVSMFDVSGLSIAMGNALVDVQRAADYVTGTNDDEGFAKAIEDFILKS